LGLLAFMLFIAGVLQAQFTVEWQFETLNRALYVGDVDGDGVGEFVDNSFQNNVRFFDAQTHAVKYTVANTGFGVEIEQSSINLPSYNNRFPYIDYNNNGVADFIFVDQSNFPTTIYRVIDPSTSAVIFTFPQNGTYQFGWLGDFDNDGVLELSVSYYGGSGSTQNVIYSTGVALTSVPDGERFKPSNFYLSQNYPNPFNPSTTIQYSVERTAHVRLDIHDVSGRLVRRLVDELSDIGVHTAIWDGRNDEREQAASGAYFYELRVGDNSQARKMLLLR
jgi:hypothetical protein